MDKIGFAVISGLLSALLSGMAIGKTPMGWGRILMEGSIIETACAIEMNSRDQAIEMITIPITKIAQDGRGIAKPFVIRLVNCTLKRVNPTHPDFKLFQVTFDGVPDGNLLGVEGEARGVGLQIKDHSGNIALPGVPLPPTEIFPGDKVLHYTMNLVPNNQKLRAGEYRSTVRFKMDYY